MKHLEKYWNMAKDNPKVTAGIIIAIVVIIAWIG
tara:strand:+ start:467 stop:568 length:102 start_codon:yes stop_codon:yes gene_type:complete